MQKIKSPASLVAVEREREHNLNVIKMAFGVCAKKNVNKSEL